MKIFLSVEKTISNDSGKIFDNTEIDISDGIKVSELFLDLKLGNSKEFYVVIDEKMANSDTVLLEGNKIKVLAMMLGG